MDQQQIIDRISAMEAEERGLYDDPDRLREPMQRQADGSFVPVSWDSALDDIGRRLKAVVKTHGRTSVGVTLGNPTGWNYGAFLLASLDPYLTETSSHADYVLPPKLLLEREGFPIFGQLHYGTPNAQWIEAIVTPPEGVRDDWWILDQICKLRIHPDDAAARSVVTGEQVSIASRWGGGRPWAAWTGGSARLTWARLTPPISEQCYQ